MYAYPSFLFNISDPRDRASAQWANGVNFLLDTAIHNSYQYGHAISRFAQLAVIDGYMNVTQIVFSKHHRMPDGNRERNLQFIYNMTVAASGLPVMMTGGRPFCAREFVYIPHYERAFWHRRQGDRWRSIVQRALAITWNNCPPPRAFYLTRPGGDVPGRTRSFIDVLRCLLSQMPAAWGGRRAAAVD